MVIYGSKDSIDGESLLVQKDDFIEVHGLNTLVRRMFESIRPEEKEKMFPKGVVDNVAMELYDFYDAVVNKHSPEVDGLEAYRDMTMPICFYESVLLKKPVAIRNVEELRVEEYQKEINEKFGVK